MSQPARWAIVLAILHAPRRVGLPSSSLSPVLPEPQSPNEPRPFLPADAQFLASRGPSIRSSTPAAAPVARDVGQFLRSLCFIAMSAIPLHVDHHPALSLHPFLRRWTRPGPPRGHSDRGVRGADSLVDMGGAVTVGTTSGRECFPSFIGYFVAGYYLLAHSEERSAWRAVPPRPRGGACGCRRIALAVFVDLPMLRIFPTRGGSPGPWRWNSWCRVMCFAALALVLRWPGGKVSRDVGGEAPPVPGPSTLSASTFCTSSSCSGSDGDEERAGARRGRRLVLCPAPGADHSGRAHLRAWRDSLRRYLP